MKLRCVRAFGNFKPGDEIEVPEGAVFDTCHFDYAELEIVETPPKPAAKKESE